MTVKFKLPILHAKCHEINLLTCTLYLFCGNVIKVSFIVRSMIICIYND